MPNSTVRAAEQVASSANPKGYSVTSTIPAGKCAKWTVKTGTARAGWSFVGQTLASDAIKSALVSGNNLVDMTFQVELEDGSKGKGTPDGRGGTGGKDKTDGKGGPDGKGGTGGKDKTDGKGTPDGKGGADDGKGKPDGKGGTDGKGTPDGKDNGGTDDNASNKLDNGSNKGTGEGSLIGKGGQSRKGTQKGAKLGNRRLSGTGDGIPLASLGFVWLGLIMSAMAIMFRRAKEEEGLC